MSLEYDPVEAVAKLSRVDKKLARLLIDEFKLGEAFGIKKF